MPGLDGTSSDEACVLGETAAIRHQGHPVTELDSLPSD
jgi:hypothetical protein